MGSKVQIPGSQFLLSWFLSFIMGLIVNKEKVVPDLHYDNLPNIGKYIYVYIYIYINYNACMLIFSSVTYSRKVLLQSNSLQRTPMIPFADQVPLRHSHVIPSQ